jgi:hypothetical protein
MEIDPEIEKDSRSDWLVWPETVRLVSVAAVWFSAELLLLLSMKFFPDLHAWSEIDRSLPIKIILVIPTVGGVLSGLFLILAMSWYWMKLDYSSKSRKTMWLIFFLCWFVGFPIYALFVYRKQILAISSLV